MEKSLNYWLLIGRVGPALHVNELSACEPMAHRRGGSAKEGDTRKEEYGNFQVGALSYSAAAPPPNSVTFRSWF